MLERREPDPGAVGAARRELAVRAALGASDGALRRTLLAESLLLCGAGAVLGVLIARPMVAILARYASRFSVRALDVTVDSSCSGSASSSPLSRRRSWRSCRGCRRRSLERLRVVERQRADHLRDEPPAAVFAVIQIAASFVLLAGAGMLLTTLFALQTAQPDSTRTTCSR